MRSVFAGVVPLFVQEMGAFEAFFSQLLGVGVDGFAGAEGWGYYTVGGILGEHPAHTGLVEHVGVTVDAAGDFHCGSGAGAGRASIAPRAAMTVVSFVGDHISRVLGEGETGWEAEVFGDTAE